MSRVSRALAVASIAALALAGCKTEKAQPSTEPQSFTFTVYPGAQYLAQQTELLKRADALLKPKEPPPAVAIYDTNAPLEAVADYYAKAYGYKTIAPDATNNLSPAKPPAYYRTGDMQADVKAVQSLLKQLKVNTDVSKAQGHYRAAEFEPRRNRPRVTVQRPYFDLINSQVIDRTVILMSP